VGAAVVGAAGPVVDVDDLVAVERLFRASTRSFILPMGRPLTLLTMAWPACGSPR